MLIQVKYLGPTNTKGSRWKATRSGMSVTIYKGLCNDTNEDAKRAAYALVEKMELELEEVCERYESKGKRGWGPLAYCGQTEQGLYIFASVSQLERQIEIAEEAFQKVEG